MAAEKSSDLTAEQKSRQESLKLLFEVYKHITTLSTGSIVILATFLEKLFKSPKEINLVTISLICFLASVVTSLYMMAFLAIEQHINRRPTILDRIGKKLFYILSPIGFIAGIIFLAIFTVINLSG